MAQVCSVVPDPKSEMALDSGVRSMAQGMTVVDVELRIEEILRYIGVKEYAFADVLERSLHLDVLSEIRQGNPDGQLLAAEAMKTGLLPYERPFVQMAALTQEQQRSVLQLLYRPDMERDIVLRRLVKLLPLLLKGIHV